MDDDTFSEVVMRRTFAVSILTIIAVELIIYVVLMGSQGLIFLCPSIQSTFLVVWVVSEAPAPEDIYFPASGFTCLGTATRTLILSCLIEAFVPFSRNQWAFLSVANICYGVKKNLLVQNVFTLP